MQNGWTERIEELEAENTRLRMYRDAAESRAQGLEVERDAAVKWLEEYKSKTYCAYCGAIFNIDSDASHVSEHIRTCPHHPMRELEAANKRLRALLHKCLMGGVFFSSDLVDEIKQALKEASHELA